MRDAHRAHRAPRAPARLLWPAAAMFCFQCEQTEDAKGCSTKGVCGKTPEVAHLQDAVVHANKSLAAVALAARTMGITDVEADRYMLHSIFATLTNVSDCGATQRRQRKGRARLR
jgi:hydroxylamine reductase (hybrid-cluster protein)